MGLLGIAVGPAEAVPQGKVLAVVELEIHVVDGVVVRAVDERVEEPEIHLRGSSGTTRTHGTAGGGGDWHRASVLGCLPLVAVIGLSPSHIPTLRGSERVLVASTEPPDDLSCLTTPGVGRPGDGAVARAVDQGHPGAHPESMRGFADSSTDLCALGCASAGSLS